MSVPCVAIERPRDVWQAKLKWKLKWKFNARHRRLNSGIIIMANEAVQSGDSIEM